MSLKHRHNNTYQKHDQEDETQKLSLLLFDHIL